VKNNSEDGSMVVEFVFYGVLLQIGILVFSLNAFNFQAQQLAADSIARHALRSYLVSQIEPEISARQVLNSFQSNAKAVLRLECEPDCTSAGSLVTLMVQVGQATASASAIR
jgi:hypothetical protein